ncbi:hypothetical protein CERZMDRAFT_104443 [Cercospora zeae-maydis SCOH1-5]|uniref:Hydrophobin n=1 Tax=Cercospora zeae-maydis SCOH1-5 TaxID=717836 RepID=A0A6A6FTK4_9PEZI|nr:hypothetical protein CERZMDRAFT_104443 [Cercospora zeae-maydis SCOH1-5]
MQFSIIAFAALAVASPMAFGDVSDVGVQARTNYGGGNGGGNGAAQVCPSGYFPQCCQTNVLGVAGLTCSNVPNMPSSNQDFTQQCAQRGSAANCCLIPLLGQGLVCDEL